MFLMFLKSVYIGIGRFSLLQVPEPSKQNGVPASELNQLSYIYNTYLHPVQCTQLCVPQSTSRFEISSCYHLTEAAKDCMLSTAHTWASKYRIYLHIYIYTVYIFSLERGFELSRRIATCLRSFHILRSNRDSLNSGFLLFLSGLCQIVKEYGTVLVFVNILFKSKGYPEKHMHLKNE